mmetsp:Transcript_10624/g.32517  ORF Transcript_10624/g.32517 Transcript_10624/m.32517 type:complete len:232 (-) Transcript_10624:174-869(-)
MWLSRAPFCCSAAGSAGRRPDHSFPECNVVGHPAAVADPPMLHDCRWRRPSLRRVLSPIAHEELQSRTDPSQPVFAGPVSCPPVPTCCLAPPSAGAGFVSVLPRPPQLLSSDLLRISLLWFVLDFSPPRVELRDLLFVASPDQARTEAAQFLPENGLLLLASRHEPSSAHPPAYLCVHHDFQPPTSNRKLLCAPRLPCVEASRCQRRCSQVVSSRLPPAHAAFLCPLPYVQ